MTTRHQNTILTDEAMRLSAPSIFATEPWHEVSSRYAFIPTIEVVNRLRSEGFMPYSAQQRVTRIEGKSPFTKHLVRFRDVRHSAVTIQGYGGLFPELVLMNAHDKTGLFRFAAGVFRSVCWNGMICGDDLVPPIAIRHSGNPDSIIEASYHVIDQFPKVLDSIESSSRLMLSAPEAEAYGEAALALRYEKDAPITPAQAIAPHRDEDREPSLWNVFNRAQENLTQGGQRGRTANGRRTRTRGITSIVEDTRFNQALWKFTERVKGLVG